MDDDEDYTTMTGEYPPNRKMPCEVCWEDMDRPIEGKWICRDCQRELKAEMEEP